MAGIAKLKRKLFGVNKDRENEIREREEIEERMKLEKEKQKKTIRILLLGPCGSGKTTILKQLRKIYNKYDENDSRIMSEYIKNAVVGYMKLLCYESQRLHDQYGEKTLVNDEFEDIRKEFVSLQSPYTLTKDIASKITTLWKDQGIKETLNKRHYYQIHQNVEYFFNRIDVLSSPEYEPNFNDYLRIRRRSPGFAQTKLVTNIGKFGKHILELIDVGGTRSERKKWMRFFSEDIDAVLYIVNISNYDCKLFEDNTTNRLIEAINLWKTIMIKGKFFSNKTVLLFFNGYDLFKQKIKRVPITVTFDDFPSNQIPNKIDVIKRIIIQIIAKDIDVNICDDVIEIVSIYCDQKEMNPNHEMDVVRFIAGKFLQVFEDQNVNLSGPLQIYRTNAIDTDNIDKIFKDIILDLVKKNIKKYCIHDSSDNLCQYDCTT